MMHCGDQGLLAAALQPLLHTRSLHWSSPVFQLVRSVCSRDASLKRLAVTASLPATQATPAH